MGKEEGTSHAYKLLSWRFGRGGQSPFGVVFGVIALVTLWALFFGEQISYWGNVAVTRYNLTGIEALAFHNINFTIFLVLLIVIVISFAGLTQ